MITQDVVRHQQRYQDEHGRRCSYWPGPSCALRDLHVPPPGCGPAPANITATLPPRTSCVSGCTFCPAARPTSPVPHSHGPAPTSALVQAVSHGEVVPIISEAAVVSTA